MHNLRLILLATLLAYSTASGALISSFATGDEDNLHAAFAFNWGGPNNSQSFSTTGTWEGGSYKFFGSVSILATIYLPLEDRFQLEMRQDFWLRTFWNDGWEPGGLGTTQAAEVRSFYNYPLFGGQPAPDPYPDYSGNNLHYHVSAFAWLQTTTFVDRSGVGLMTYNISRTPFNVPDTGSTLLLLGIALAGLVALRFKPGVPEAS